jgi:uncharacterized protein YcbK (DUF882 family)
MASIKEDRVIGILTQQLQNSDVVANLPPAARTVVNSAIEQAAVINAQNIIKSTENYSNQQLSEIPKNLIGQNNPVDIVAKNTSASDLTNFLTPEVSENVTPKLSSQLADTIVNLVNEKLPSNIKQSLNINALAGSIASAAGIATNRGVASSLASFNQELFGKLDTPTYLNSTFLTNQFSSNPGQALENISRAFDSTISQKALQEARQFNVNTPTNSEKLITQTVGFIDPTATYPTQEYKGIAETNKLATGDVNGTIVQQKDKDRLRGIQLPNEQFWEQPPVPYKGQYPYNKVLQTESGHVIETDDTPGAERIQIYHRSGTFVEIDANGSVVKKTKGSSYEIVDKNGYISVTGDANLSVRGSIKIFVGGDADIEVEGDTNVKCFNDITMQAAGRVDISATEEINLHSANINIEADVNLSMKGDINTFVHTKDFYLKANNNSFLHSLNNYYVFANNNSFHQTTNNYNLYAGGSIFKQAAGSSHLKVGENINEDAAAVYINSGTSSEASKSAASKYAFAANIGLIGTRKDIVYETIPDPISANFLDEKGYVAEDSEFEEEAEKQAQSLKKVGIASTSDLNQTAVEIESDSPRSLAPSIIVPDQSILSQTYLPENYQLSKHYTLANLTTKAAVSKFPLRAQAGLSYGQIAYNLSGVALNILEPILALYPKALVTSAFRTTENSSSTSDHPKGKAVDIQFPGLAKAQYFEIAKKLATQLNYDKLLLEYKTYGTGLPWIHISFDINNPRKIVLTYLNDKKYKDGLVNLA